MVYKVWGSNPQRQTAFAPLWADWALFLAAQDSEAGSGTHWELHQVWELVSSETRRVAKGKSRGRGETAGRVGYVLWVVPSYLQGRILGWCSSKSSWQMNWGTRLHIFGAEMGLWSSRVAEGCMMRLSAPGCLSVWHFSVPSTKLKCTSRGFLADGMAQGLWHWVDGRRLPLTSALYLRAASPSALPQLQQSARRWQTKTEKIITEQRAGKLARWCIAWTMTGTWLCL